MRVLIKKAIEPIEREAEYVELEAEDGSLLIMDGRAPGRFVLAANSVVTIGTAGKDYEEEFEVGTVGGLAAFDGKTLEIFVPDLS